MKNFLEEVDFGREGGYKGLSGGLPRFDKFTNSIQKASYHAIGAPPKAGKTAFLDHRYVISPYLLDPQAKINWIYYSYEISELDKIAKFVAYFMYTEHNILCDSNYILSRGDNKLKDNHLKLIEGIYEKYIIPLFGERDDNGNLIKRGRVDFHEDRTNPTGIRNYLMHYAEQHGEFIFEEYEVKNEKGKKEKRSRILGYRENDPNLHTIIIIDHVGLLRIERGYSKKQNIDKMSEYFVWFRNICKFTPIAVSQFNRDLGKIDRLKFSGEDLQPQLEDFKDKKSIQHQTFLTYYKQELRDKEVSILMNLSFSRISQIRRSLSLPRNFKFKRKDFLKYYMEGLNDEQIALKLNVSAGRISVFRRSLSLISNKSNSIKLSNKEISVLVGTVLGDGHLYNYKDTAMLKFDHSIKQSSYIFYKYKLLIRLFKNRPKYLTQFDKRTLKTNKKFSCITRSFIELKAFRLLFYPKGKKVITKELCSLITPLSLAIYYMDDGFKHRKNCYYSMCAYNEESIENFRNLLLFEHNIKTSVHKNNYLYIKSESTNEFIKLIKPFIIEEMLYKVSL